MRELPKFTNEELAQISPAGYARLASGGHWECPKHLALLSSKLVDILAGRINRLIVEMPPRHGKSMLISEYFPGWYVGHKPNENVILASYEADFASSWGAKSRDAFLTAGKQVFGLDIVDGYRAPKKFWRIKGHAGGIITAGVGGPLTGKGGNLIIDDPIKNDKEARSKTQRDSIYEWYRSTAYTRIEPGCFAIVIMTRWHKDDLVGRLVKEMKAGGEYWEVLSLPAFAVDSDDALGREIGEPLWEERYNKKALETIRTAVGSYWWGALYQQNPTVASGSIFKQQYFLYYTLTENDTITLYCRDDKTRVYPIELLTFFQTVDTAMKTGKENDYTCVMTFAITPDSDILIWDIFTDKIEIPEQFPAIKRQAEKHPRVTFIGIEDRASGTGIIQEAKLEGLSMKPLKTDSDKVVRAITATIAYENGNVYHRTGASWLEDFEEELLAFDKGPHDDMVDTLSYGALIVKDMALRASRPISLSECGMDGEGEGEGEDEDEDGGVRDMFAGMRLNKPR